MDLMPFQLSSRFFWLAISTRKRTSSGSKLTVENTSNSWTMLCPSNVQVIAAGKPGHTLRLYTCASSFDNLQGAWVYEQAAALLVGWEERGPQSLQSASGAGPGRLSRVLHQGSPYGLVNLVTPGAVRQKRRVSSSSKAVLTLPQNTRRSTTGSL